MVGGTHRELVVTYSKSRKGGTVSILSFSYAGGISKLLLTFYDDYGDLFERFTLIKFFNFNTNFDSRYPSPPLHKYSETVLNLF